MARNNELAERFERELLAVKAELLAYTRHLLWRRDDLPDALQTIMLTAFRRFSGFQPGSNFRAWIFKVATYEIFNFNRKSDRDRRLRVELDEVESAADEIDAEIHYDELLHKPEALDRLLNAELAAAISRLSPNERAVLLLRILGGFSTLETARMLAMPAGSVMGFLGRARRKLRLALANAARDENWLSPAKGVDRR